MPSCMAEEDFFRGEPVREEALPPRVCLRRALLLDHGEEKHWSWRALPRDEVKSLGQGEKLDLKVGRGEAAK